MSSEKTLDSIPIDLFHEIFSRLPSKSVGRCRCVSARWASILGHQDFTELFLTRSSTRPRILFALEKYNGEWLFYSSPHPHQNTYEKSIVVSVDFHTKFHRSRCNRICSYASGLLYISDVWISTKSKDGDSMPVICNPLTGHYLGYDPIDKQFKALAFIAYLSCPDVHVILTVQGTEKMGWRKIHCPFTHHPSSEGICINGVLYYYALQLENRDDVIVCFDVRTEKFKFIDANFVPDQVHNIINLNLINYKGKLGMIYWRIRRMLSGEAGTKFDLEWLMWVLEDVHEKNLYFARD
ncbi:PREDICTED: putative F-box protein At1g30925 [Camelina sativa]|uniref:F-box protein At1g30925 n=1 Tax=Camelina sativa TaxID=90675 RepID=A0ABM1R650_CAMSA|nr:PREDICTED: putative F-box protein At1g30925 [Camelina sativa]